MQEVTQISRLVAARLGSSSGVFSARPEAARFSTFSDALDQDAIRPISNENWSQIRSAIRGGEAEIRRVDWPGVPSGSAFIPLFSEDILVAAQLNLALGLVDRSYTNAVAVSSDKLEFYRRLKVINSYFPRFEKIFGDTEMTRSTFLDRGVEEVVVKPATGSGSEGVSRADLRVSGALDASLARAKLATSPGAPILAMEYIAPGSSPSEIALNFIVRDSNVRFLELHAKVVQTTEPPFRDNVIASFSPSSKEMRKYNEAAEWITQALGLRTGVVQSELRIDMSGQIVPIDVAVRPDGGLVPDSVLTMRDLDIRMVHVLVQLGALEAADDLLLRALPTRRCETALGAFYSQKLPKDVAARIWHSFHDTSFPPDGLVSGMYGIEGSLMPLASTELRFGLCTAAETADSAIERLRRIAREFGADC